MVKKRKFSIRKFILFLIVLVILAIVIFIGLYKFNTLAVSNTSKKIEFTVEEGSSYYTLASSLKEKELIKSAFFYKVYLKLHAPSNLTTGTYELNQNMDVGQIVGTLGNDNNSTDNSVKLTFREGLNISQMASVISRKTDITSEEFINKVSDETYIDSLKDKYWFITDDVKNPEIYYDLEGYLFPDTYILEKDEVNLDNLLSKILDNTLEKLESYRAQIESSGYSVHEILTLASLVELEAVTDEDRAKVAGVFYNRLNDGWSLGSDVTTYYSARKLMTEKLTTEDLTTCNGYNTRCTSMRGLPVGPIDNPSLSAIEATINPEIGDYYYFVADSDKKVYFTRNSEEHTQIINELKEEGKWIG